MKRFYLIPLLLTTLNLTLLAQNYNCAVYPGNNNNVQLFLDTCIDSILWQVKDTTIGNWIDIPNSNNNPYDLDLNNHDILISAFRAKTFSSPSLTPKYTYPFGIKPISRLSELEAGDYYNGAFIYYSSLDTILGTQFFQEDVNVPFGCVEIDINEAEKIQIGYGLQNTEEILDTCLSENIAADVVDKAIINNHDDWYLPSFHEAYYLISTLVDNRIHYIERPSSCPILTNKYSANPPLTVSKKRIWTSTQTGTTHAYSTSGESINTLNKSTFKEFRNYVFPSRNIKQDEIGYTTCDAILIPYQFNDQIMISQSPSNSSVVIVEFVGNVENIEVFNWDFGKGEVLSGSEDGPYQVFYNFGGLNQVKLQIESNCNSPLFFSEEFRLDVIEDIESNFPEVFGGCMMSADYDNDGLIDILLSGSDTTQLYKNMGQDLFVEVLAPFPNLSKTRASWGDYNNDNFLDLLLTGFSPVDSIPKTIFYENKGNGEFETLDLGLPSVADGFVEWLDYNLDGRSDILISGKDIDGRIITDLYSNNGNNTFILEMTPFPNVTSSSVAIDDYNNDNFVDLLILGNNGEDRVTKIYKNNSGTYKELEIELIGIDNGDAVWEDINNDGSLDFIYSGNKQDFLINDNQTSINATQSGEFQVYINSGVDSFMYDNTFSRSPNRNVHSLASLDSGDYNHDGLSDIVITGVPWSAWAIGGTGGSSGNDNINFRTRPNLLLNKGRTLETLELNLPATWSSSDVQSCNYTLNGTFESSNISFIDYNNDGSLDIAREGRKQNSTSAIYKNLTPFINRPPAIPINLDTEVTCDSIVLLWDNSTDDNTIQENITYEIYLGSSSDRGDIYSKKNKRKLRTNRLVLPSLTSGTYFWGVKAVDNARNESSYSTEQEFEVNCLSNIDNDNDDIVINIYPNPVENHVTVNVSGLNRKARYVLLNSIGQELYKQEITNTVTISSANLVPGIYFIKVYQGDNSQTKKIVKH